MREKMMSEHAVQFLGILQNRWVGHTLVALARGGPQRFNALKRLIPGISAKMLSDRLILLTEAGLVEQRHVSLGGARQLYGLTAYGERVAQGLEQLLLVAESPVFDAAPSLMTA